MLHKKNAAPVPGFKLDKRNFKKYNVAVVGLGYVGLPLACLSKTKGHDVLGLDINASKVKSISEGKSPIRDEFVTRCLHKSPLKVSVDFSLLSHRQIIVVCVPTPIDKQFMPDLTPVRSAAETIGRFLKKGQLVVLESTVNPGVSEEVVIPILEEKSSLKAGKDFHFAYCPERINPGDKHWGVYNIPRVIGGFDKQSLAVGLSFYNGIVDNEIMAMSTLKEAEAVKIIENTFRDVNIAFVNELAMSFSELGIDVVNVIKGAATKPFAFLAHFPGCGVGGHCIPVDPYYLIERARQAGFYHDFLSLARRINNRMPEFTAELTMKALNEKGYSINNAKVAVLGMSYKPGIDDARESPSFEIVHWLKKFGADVVTYDPYAKQHSSVQNLVEALKGAKAAVIATAHPEFMRLSPAYFLDRGVDVLIDGRNCLPKEKFLKSSLVYKGIGR